MPRCRSYDASLLKAYKQNSFMFVDTLAALIKLRDTLANHSIVGVDLENNHTDSYNGFVCLIQLSTYNTDSGEILSYIIDVLASEVG